MELFFQSKTEKKFKNFFLSANIETPYLDNLYQELKVFLKEKNKKREADAIEDIKLLNSNLALSECYCFNNTFFQINYDSQSNKNLIHASLKHLKVKESHQIKNVFDIKIDNEIYYLFNNKKLVISCKINEFHLVQGKLILLIFNTIYDKKEHDWVATFHASTISDGKSAIMCVGNSGKGKSTLTALLMSNGFELVADDISPLLRKNNHIYQNPCAISIKKGAFKLFENIFKDFKNIETHFINDIKGKVKYLPSNKSNLKSNYPCKKVVLVNYSKEMAYKLEKVNTEIALNTLIPESWISPKKRNAKSFLKWVDSCEFYQLTYSKTNEAIDAFEKLFKS